MRNPREFKIRNRFSRHTASLRYSKAHIPESSTEFPLRQYSHIIPTPLNSPNFHTTRQGMSFRDVDQSLRDQVSMACLQAYVQMSGNQAHHQALSGCPVEMWDFSSDFPSLPPSIASQKPQHSHEDHLETEKVSTAEIPGRPAYASPSLLSTSSLQIRRDYCNYLTNRFDVSEDLDSSCSEALEKRFHNDDDDKDDRIIIRKQMIRRENNRAAARRSNYKKKLEREARKKELATLRQIEVELREKDVRLRQENLWLRSLVYPEEHQY